MTAEPYVDARKLALLMGVSRSTVKRLTAEGMPSETWGMSRTRRYLPSEAMRWARERDRGPIVKGDNRDRRGGLTTAAPQREE